MNEENKCPECEAYHGHHPLCSLMTDEEARNQLKKYYQAWLEKDQYNRGICEMYNRTAQLKVNRLREECTKWRGKFVIVKEENNQLRKKIARQK